MKAIMKNLNQAVKYADTQLLELGLSAIMLFLNPVHLWYISDAVQHKEKAAVSLMILGSILCGCLFVVGVGQKCIKKRFVVARLYWFLTLFSLFSLMRFAKLDLSLVASFGLQFTSAIFLAWRLDSELRHRKSRGF